tara:strand:+ start:554 stop:1123 length:570 start_codon:yes stop_codon:yes gene_type:complete
MEGKMKMKLNYFEICFAVLAFIAILLLAWFIVPEARHNGIIHEELRDKYHSIDRRTDTDIVGMKSYAVKKDLQLEGDFKAADNKINESLVNVLEELRLIKNVNKRHQDHLMTLFTNLDSVITTIDKIRWSQIDLSSHVKRQFEDVAQWPPLLEGQINKLAESQYIAIDSLWSFLKINGTRKMKKTLNPQ